MNKKINITTDHKEIMKWAEKYNGQPAVLMAPGFKSRRKALRIDFPGINDDRFLSSPKLAKIITWKEFFRAFDEMGLAFMYQARKRFEDITTAYMFVPRDK